MNAKHQVYFWEKLCLWGGQPGHRKKDQGKKLVNIGVIWKMLDRRNMHTKYEHHILHRSKYQVCRQSQSLQTDVQTDKQKLNNTSLTLFWTCGWWENTHTRLSGSRLWAWNDMKLPGLKTEPVSAWGRGFDLPFSNTCEQINMEILQKLGKQQSIHRIRSDKRCHIIKSV